MIADLKVYAIGFSIFFMLISCYSIEITQDEKPLIACSLQPQLYYIEKIVGNKASAFALLPPNASAEHFEIKPRDLVKLQKSKIWVTIGGLFLFERRSIQKISRMNNTPKIIDSSEGIIFTAENQTRHHEKNIHDDPHIWLSPRLMKIQAENFYKALITMDSKNTDYYTHNFLSLIQELETLDTYIKNRLQNMRRKKFIVFHPSWGYFARDYGLQQIAIEHEGKEPGIKYMKLIIDKAREEGLRTLFIDPQLSMKQAELIAREINGRLIVIDPLTKNYNENLKKFVNILANNE